MVLRVVQFEEICPKPRHLKHLDAFGWFSFMDLERCLLEVLGCLAGTL